MAVSPPKPPNGLAETYELGGIQVPPGAPSLGRFGYTSSTVFSHPFLALKGPLKGPLEGGEIKKKNLEFWIFDVFVKKLIF